MYQELKDFAKELADESGNVIKKYFRTDVNIESKSDESPVTIADKRAEEVMRELIMKKFPEHGILGEEFGEHKSGSEYKWILDPIDGTKSFICGTYTFGTLIALMKNDKPILGVINQPVLNEFLIGDNETAELNGKRVSARNCTKIEDSVILTTDHFNVEKYQNIEKFEKLAKKARLYRKWGDCYGYYLVATGYADIMIDPIMSKWDTMALIPVIKGAGAEITDYHGNDPVEGESIIASVKGLHKKVIEELN